MTKTTETIPDLAWVQTLPARDPDAALEGAGGDRSLADELLAVLLAGLPEAVAALRAAFAASDWRELAEGAHRIRGGTRYCGVPALDAAVAALEQAARAGDAPRIADWLGGVETEARRLTLDVSTHAQEDRRP